MLLDVGSGSTVRDRSLVRVTVGQERSVRVWCANCRCPSWLRSRWTTRARRTPGVSCQNQDLAAHQVQVAVEMSMSSPILYMICQPDGASAELTRYRLAGQCDKGYCTRTGTRSKWHQGSMAYSVLAVVEDVRVDELLNRWSSPVRSVHSEDHDPGTVRLDAVDPAGQNVDNRDDVRLVGVQREPDEVVPSSWPRTGRHRCRCRREVGGAGDIGAVSV